MVKNPRTLLVASLRVASLLAIGVWAAAMAGPVRGSDDFSFARCAPEETLLFCEVDNILDLREAWGKTPYARLWNAPQFAPFWKPARARLKELVGDFEGERQVRLEELKRLFPGRFCIYMSDLRYDLGSGQAQVVYKEINTGLIARFAPGAQDRVRELVEENVLGQLPGNAERSVDEFRGVRIYTSVFVQNQTGGAAREDDGERRREGPVDPERHTTDSGVSVPPMGTAEYHYEYAFVDDVLFLLEGQRAFMRKTLTNYFAAKEGRVAETSMAGSANYARIARELGDRPGIRVYSNVQRHLQQIAADPSIGRMAANRALGLGELRAAAVNLHLGQEAAVVRFALTSVPRPAGVASLMIREARNDFATIGLAPKDAWTWSSSAFDIAQVYALLRDTIQEASPQGWKAIAQTMAGVEQQSGAKLEDDILAALGGAIANYGRPPAGALAGLSQPGMGDPSQPRQVWFVATRRSEGLGPKLAKFLEITLSMLGRGTQVRAKAEQFQAYTIYRFAAQGMPGAQGAGGERSLFCYAVTPSHIVLSSDAAELREVLRRASGAGGESLRDSADFRKAFDSFPEGAVARSWQDSPRVMRHLAESLRNNPIMLMLGARFLDASNMPDPEAFGRHFGQSTFASYVGADVYTIQGRLMYPARY